VATGILHFCFIPLYVRIVPPCLPEPRLLVLISGAAQVLGGVGLLVPATRRAAAWGLVVLLIAVLPANIRMAVDHERWRSIPEWTLWLRVPLQLPLIWWAWVYTQPNR
jgi:uncharacterized membrane protein